MLGVFSSSELFLSTTKRALLYGQETNRIFDVNVQFFYFDIYL